MSDDGRLLTLLGLAGLAAASAVRTGSFSSEPAYLSLTEVERWVPVMKKRGVSEVARSPRGFLTAYRDVGGRKGQLDDFWVNRRAGFIARHMAQVKQNHEKLWEIWRGQKVPTRRHLALIAWAYSPAATELRRLDPPALGSRLKTVLGQDEELEKPTKCRFCGKEIVDGRRVSGYTGGPHWMTEDGDFGCDNNPASDYDGVADHEPIDSGSRLKTTQPNLSDWKVGVIESAFGWLRDGSVTVKWANGTWSNWPAHSDDFNGEMPVIGTKVTLSVDETKVVPLTYRAHRGSRLKTTKPPTGAPRKLSAVAEAIRLHWKDPYFAAVPYLNAMLHLESIDGDYDDEDGRSIVRYFLANASRFRGPEARRLKDELKDMLAAPRTK